MANPLSFPRFPITLAARALVASCGVVLCAHAPALAQPAPQGNTITLDALDRDTIDESTLDNLVAWARLHGYITHFNPSEWAWTTNMLAYLRDGFDPVAQAQNPGELAAALERLAKPVAPASLVWPSDEDRPPLPDLRSGARGEVGAVIAWRHDGFTPVMDQNGPLFSRRVIYNLTANEALRLGFAPDNAYQAELPGGVTVRVPHANYVDRFGSTLPNPTPRERVRKDWPNEWTYATASERLAAVSYAWGLIQHFHPTIDREALNWDAALREAMRDALAATDRESTLRIVQRLLAKVGDAQAEAWDPNTPVPGLPPFNAAVIDGALIVTGVDASIAGAGVKSGDEIVSIDGVPARDALNEWRTRMGAGTPEARDARAVLAALSGFPASAIELTVRARGGAVREVTLPRSRPAFVAVNEGEEPIREVAPGIVYVDGSRVTDAHVFVDAERVLAAPGVIFDLRSPFTDMGMSTLGWVAPTQGRTSDQYIHTPMHPDHNEVHITRRDTRIMPNPFNAIGKVVFLVGPGTRGDAEFAALTMQDFDLGILVGRHTAGAPGWVAQGILPGGLAMTWTGLESRSVTGTDIFGRGVPVDVEAIPTRESVASGEDAGIQSAIRALNEHFDSLETPAPTP